MLSFSSRQLNNVFERIVKDKNGVLVRVRFIVVENNGEYKAQIVSAEPLLRDSGSAPCLPEAKIKSSVIFTYKPAAHKSGFYFNPLFFFTSQPTRAPSF